MFTALLDTSVLWPSLQRDVLLSFALEGIYRPVWSSAILAELEYHEERKLLRRGIGPTEAQRRAGALIAAMRAAFDDAEVEGWEPLEGHYGLPDPDDEHVVAAAVVGGAGVIVTSNLKDFPRPSVPTSLEVQSPAQFAHHTVSLNPVAAFTRNREDRRPQRKTRASLQHYGRPHNARGAIRPNRRRGGTSRNHDTRPMIEPLLGECYPVSN